MSTISKKQNYRYQFLIAVVYFYTNNRKFSHVLQALFLLNFAF